MDFPRVQLLPRGEVSVLFLVEGRGIVAALHAFAPNGGNALVAGNVARLIGHVAHHDLHQHLADALPADGLLREVKGSRGHGGGAKAAGQARARCPGTRFGMLAKQTAIKRLMEGGKKCLSTIHHENV